MAKSPKPSPAPMGDNAEKAERDTFDYHKARVLRLRRGPLALALAKVKALQKQEKNMLSEAKNDGIKIEQFKLHLKKAELERVKPGLGKDHATTQAKYDRWGGLALGEQGDLFAAKGLSPTPGERADKWFERGYNDIRYGELDPEGFEEEDGTKSPCTLMPGVRPSYVPVENFNDWSQGASKAQEEIDAEFIARQSKDPDGTPIENAAANQEAGQANEKEFADTDI